LECWLGSSSEYELGYLSEYSLECQLECWSEC
jgi:hypothetical protein